MRKSNVRSVGQDPGGRAVHRGDNGYAVSARAALAMSNNRRTLQDVGAWPACIASERRLTQENGGPA